MSGVTVAPRPVFTGAEIASGHREIADMFDRKPWIALSIRNAGQPLQYTIPLVSRDDVEALAYDNGVTPEEDRNGFLIARFMRGGVLVELNAAPARPLRRDPEATAVLAERDA